MRKSDVLFLIVGTNPMPNIISIINRVKEDGKVFLIHSREKNKELEEKRAREEERKAMETYVNDCHKKLVDAQNLYIKAKQDYLKKYGGYDSLFRILF